MGTLWQALEHILRPNQVFKDLAVRTAYEFDASLARGRPDTVVIPETAAEVVKVAQVAEEYGVPLVARGAGTGLSGGAIANRGGIVIAFTRMDRILRIDKRNRLAIVEPGLINNRLTTEASEHGLYYAPDPSSQRVCTLGGKRRRKFWRCTLSGTWDNHKLCSRAGGSDCRWTADLARRSSIRI